MMDSPDGFLRSLVRAALVAALWLGAAAWSHAMAHTTTQTIPVWLSSGVTFSALLLAARWRWPALLAGAACAAVLWAVAAHGLTLGAALAYGAVEVVSMAAGAWVVTRSRQAPASPSATLALLGGAVLASLLAATLACAVWAEQRPQADLVLEWRVGFLSTLVGLLLIAPLASAYRDFRVRRSGGLPMAPFLGGGAAFAAFVAAVLLVFSQQAQQRWGGVAATLAYVPMPFLLAAALLWGARGGTVATLLGAMLIIYRTAQGGGPFALHEGFPGESVIEVQGFITAWVVVLLLASALSEGRRSALHRARDWQLRYERTLRAVGVASVEYDTVTGGATWGEGAAEVLGADAAAADSVDAWLDLIDPAERGLVQAAWQQVSAGQRSTSEQSYALHLAGGATRRVRERLAAVQGGDGRVERIVALLEVVRPEPSHG
ncbi:Integral membrane sensor domain MASE1 [Duganella sacchari]|uniref:Integral membrane sensor domain MASE1 n=1 Tax=Duganella sacchari TaxID=551987 RepID=A0A1M7NR02_9BURK|nr:MASE1 domain-containing protein [Duganella sacchari]SHN05874.1 Integral membrane sensor domain MASE1 [Duganella sacchari]